MDWLMELVESGETVDVLLHGSVSVVQRSVVEVCNLGIVVADNKGHREFYPWHYVRGIRGPSKRQPYSIGIMPCEKVAVGSPEGL